MSAKELGPDFLIIGAHKSATTSLHDLLSEIPQVFMTKEKEPRYFALKDDDLDYRGPRDPASKCKYQSFSAYSNLFKGAKAGDIKGESSTLYIYDERAPLNIYQYNPEIKIIAILRDPIKRAISNYNYALMHGREDLDFEEALEMESKRIDLKWGPFWHYLKKGLYGVQLKRYFELFPKENIKVILYEDFINDQIQTTANVLEFLGVTNKDLPLSTNKSSNKTLIPKNKVAYLVIRYRNYIQKIIPSLVRQSEIGRKVNRLLFKSPHKVSEAIVDRLRKSYAEDKIVLEELIEKKIECWR